VMIGTVVRYRMVPVFVFFSLDKVLSICCHKHMKFYYVYVLRSRIKDYIYIGYSEDLRKRFERHNAGYVQSTKSFKPYDLIFYESYRSMSDAKRREIYLKTNKGRKTLMTMLHDYMLSYTLTGVMH